MRVASVLSVASLVSLNLAPRAQPPVALERGSARETILALLSQRALQTQLFYFNQFKNDHPKQWLERYAKEMGAPKLGLQGGQMLHAQDAMLGLGEKDEFLLGMMGAPDETHEVEVVWGNWGGLSPGNPYLQQQKRKTRTFQDTVSPAKLAHQLMKVRESIAEEWQEDVKLFKLDNAELRRHHAEEVRSVVDMQERFQHAIRPESSGEESTPLRDASFDLLKTAATCCAVRRLYRTLNADELQRHQSEWLRVFVQARNQPLRGQHGWHAARGFVLDMMAQPISVGTSPGGQPRFLDPLALGEQILDLREEIAEEWAEALSEMPEYHLRLARMRLEEREREPELVTAERREPRELERVRPLRISLDGLPPRGFVWGPKF